MRRLLIFVQVSLVAAFGCSPSTRLPTPEELERAQEHASAEDLRRDLGVLAADSLGGRGTPSAGLSAALDYVETHVREIGLEPAGVNGTYRQSWSMRSHERTSDAISAVATVGGTRVVLTPDIATQLMLGVSGADIPVSAPLVFAGFGINSPEHEWNDYDATDVAGKAVVIMEGAPWDVDLSMPFGYDKALHKSVEAYVHGAKAVIYAVSEYGRSGQPPSTQFLMPYGQIPIELFDTDLEGRSFVPPVFLVSYETANRLLGSGTIQGYQRQCRESMEPVGFDIPNAQFELSISTPAEAAEADNLIAVLRGSDPELSDEYIAYGAHIDHLGIGAPIEGDSIYNGADDNASGSVALLAIARSFAALPEDARPKRSIAFYWFSGEELGLFGSKAVGDRPTIPFVHTVAHFNLDMVGRALGDTLLVDDFGSGQLFSVMHDLADEVGVTVAPSPFPDYRLLYYSDHLVFFANRVPSMYMTTGFHPDYHFPSDEIELVNIETMEKIARLSFLAGLELANRDERITWNAPPYFGAH